MSRMSFGQIYCVSDSLVTYGATYKLVSTYYRATLCAVFAVARCLPDCHVGALYIRTAEDIVKFLVQPGIPVIVFLTPQCRYPTPRGTPAAGAKNTRAEKWSRDHHEN